MRKDSKEKAAGLAHFETDVHGGEGVSVVTLPRTHGIGSELLQWLAEISILKSVQIITLLGGLAFLLQFSLHLAGARAYHVDECTNISVARLVATGQAVPSVDLFQLLLSKLLPNSARSIDLFAAARLTMVMIFWVNWLLVAVATGERLLSGRWLMALAGVATIAPFWDWGFEVRRENLVIAGLLLAWTVVRFGPGRLQRYFVVGAIMGIIQFFAPDAFVCTIPLSLMILVFPPSGIVVIRWRLALAWVSGLAGALAAGYVVFGVAGLGNCYKAGSGFWPTGFNGDYTFDPGQSLVRLVTGAPLFAALLAAALIDETMNCFRQRSRTLNWEGNLPEALLFIGMVAMVIPAGGRSPNSTMYLFPFAFLFVFRYVVTLIKQIQNLRFWAPAIIALVIFIHLVPFGFDARKNSISMNFDQEGMMTLVEDLTDPVKDRVFDRIGMVATRRTVASQFPVQGSSFPGSDKSSVFSIHEILAAQPAVILLLDRSTQALVGETDRTFIRDRYVSLADDFWVLGKALPPGGGRFDIIHTGRYRVASLQGSDIAGTFPTGLEGLRTPEIAGVVKGQLDGEPLSLGVVELTAGSHRIETGADCQPTVVWVGPQMDRIHRLRQSNSEEPSVYLH